MRQRTIILATLALAVSTAILPRSARAMQITVGGRAGTLGLGAEVVVVANEWFSLRGGAGLAGFNADVTSLLGLDDNQKGKLAVPRSIYTLGADLVVGNFRIGGGVLYKEHNPVYALTLGSGAHVDIGESTYTDAQVSRVTTTLLSREWAPYVLVGLGQPVTRGLGLFLDVGVAFLDQPELAMSATGDRSVIATRDFRRDLQTEVRSVRDDAGDLVKYWPIVSLGVQFGFGGGDRRRGGR